VQTYLLVDDVNTKSTPRDAHPQSWENCWHFYWWSHWSCI